MGLALKKFKEVNIALLSKWLWKFGSCPDHLWCKIIRWKYGSDGGGWFMKIGYKPHGTGLWKGILGCKEVFSKFIHLKGANGTRIRFWMD